MLSNYNLYFNNLPGLESRCRSAGIPVSDFLCAGVSHVVILNKEKLCPILQSKISKVGAKLMIARAVNKWLVDFNLVKRHNSPPQKSSQVPATPPTCTVTQRAELVVSDVDHLYKPQFLTKVAVPSYPSYPCSGSPWDRRNSPGQSPRPTTATKPTATSSFPKPNATSAAPKTAAASRTTFLHTLSRKVFCENCRVSVAAADLDAHFATLQHRKFAATHSNFSALDEVIGEATLDNFLACQASNKRRRVQTAPAAIKPIGYPFKAFMPTLQFHGRF